MIRTLLCAVLSLFLVAGLSFAGPEKGKGKGKKANVAGKVVKFNAETGELTLATGKKGAGLSKELKLTDSVDFVIFEGEASKNLKGKEGFKELKEGDLVRVTSDKDGKVLKVQIGGKKKKKK